MPFPTQEVIAAGGSIIQGTMNAIAQGSANRKQRQYQNEVYDKQRRDSLADWNMQNEYNSPSAQMDRYKAAGLNPHLIYGQQSQGATVRATTQGDWRPQPTISGDTIPQSVGKYFDSRLQQQTLNNLKAQEDSIKADTALKQANAILAASNTNLKNFDFGFKSEYRDMLGQTLSLRNDNMQFDLDNKGAQYSQTLQNIDLTKKRLDHEILKMANTQKEKERLEGVIEMLKKDGTLKDLEINLRKNGLSSSDPAWQRIIGQILAKYGVTL